MASKTAVDYWQKRVGRVATVHELEQLWVRNMPIPLKEEEDILNVFKLRKMELTKG